MFLFRYAVGDDAGTGAGVYVIPLLIGQADADTAIHIAGKIDVADGAAVNAALMTFQFINDFAGPDFRSPGQGAGRQGSRNGIDGRLIVRIVLCTVEPICMIWEKRRTLR